MLSKYGPKIRTIREKNNDTLEELAKKLNMSFSTLSKYERGDRKITPELLEEVAKVYDVPLSSFFGDTLIEIPEELKELGTEWISVMKEYKDEGLTPEEVKAVKDIIKQHLELAKKLKQ